MGTFPKYCNISWTAVDIMVGVNGQINSFVLDAANASDYKGMHTDLKAAFPGGNHYVYKRDFLPGEGKPKPRQIQTLRGTSCQVFVTEHLRQ